MKLEFKICSITEITEKIKLNIIKNKMIVFIPSQNSVSLVVLLQAINIIKMKK